MGFFEKIFNSNKVHVYAFTGRSGTGKSFRAKLVGQKYHIKAFIDDGLLILGDEIVAGKTAKHEDSYMGAVRVALFDEKEHRDEVAKAIRYLHLKKILIIGTSDKMAAKIATRLQLPPPEKIVHIEDIATPEEIAEAQRSRLIEGKHVIPVRSFEVKHKYSKIFNNAVHVYKDQNEKVFEKSIVRPAFSQKPRKEISHAKIANLAFKAVLSFNKNIKIKRLLIKPIPSGYKFLMTVDFPFDSNLAQTISELQKYVIKDIENESGVLIEEISVILDHLIDTDAA